MNTEQIRDDLVLFVNDLPEYINSPEGLAIQRLWYEESDADIEGLAWERTCGLDTEARAKMTVLLNAYWTARNA